MSCIYVTQYCWAINREQATDVCNNVNKFQNICSAKEGRYKSVHVVGFFLGDEAELIYSDREQISGGLGAVGGNGLQRGPRKLWG